MTNELTLDALSRTKENINKLKKEGYVPGVLYGSKTKSASLKVKRIQLEKIYLEAGESSIFDINLDGKKIKVIIKDIQKSPLKNEIEHVDFYQVDMAKKIEVELPLNFIGESKLVKTSGGTLSINLNTLKVACLPSELLDHLDVDISVLENYSDHIRVSDLKLPASFEVLSEVGDLIVNVLEPKKQEAEPAIIAKDAEPAKAGEAKKDDSAGKK